MKQNGFKDDKNKLRWDLLPVEIIEDVVKVLTYGANKYDDNNWKYVENGIERFYGALMRHIVAWRKGNKNDEETNLPHLAHAICCLIFILYLDKNLNKEKDEN